MKLPVPNCGCVFLENSEDQGNGTHRNLFQVIADNTRTGPGPDH